MEGDPQFPRDYLRGCLLLLVAESPAHGYELIERVCALGIRRGNAPQVYRTLRTMEDEGLVASRWEHSATGPARRKYQVTDPGQEWLRGWASSLDAFQRHFSSCLARHRLVANTGSHSGLR